MISVLLLYLVTSPAYQAEIIQVEGYTVTWYRDEVDYQGGWCELRDVDGGVVVRLEDYFVAPLGLHQIRPDAIIDVDNDGQKEVVLESWTGGAHGSNKFMVWSLGENPKCLLAWDKGNIGDEYDFVFEDVDGDGSLEVLTWYDGFAYRIFGAYTGQVPMVLKLAQGRYVDRTLSYPAITRRIWQSIYNKRNPMESWEHRKAVEIDLPNPMEQMHMLEAWIYAWLQGSVDPTLDVLDRCSEVGAAWLKKQESAVIQCLELRQKRITYPEPYQNAAWSPGTDTYLWSWN